MKKLLLAFAGMLLSVSMAFAQRAISGTVTNDGGEALIGASVLAKGTTAGTVTDFDGHFSLNVPDGVNTLVISYTGYDTKEVELGDASMITVILSEGVQLGEVVVTGLGIKREKKALGYGVSSLSGDAVAAKPESDVAKIMSGKVTGVNVTQTSGMVGTGTNIIIRGYSSITGNNQPLFVVDGVPFNSAANTDKNFVKGGATASSRFLDLDPNNIKDISVLKGLAATTLYGEQGRNGVILVTTKTGEGSSSDKGMEVSLSQTFGVTQVANLPKYQNKYGNGFSGNFGWYFSNWGPGFDVRGSNGIDDKGQIAHPLDQDKYESAFPQFQGVRYDYKPYTSAEDFFQKGNTSTTSLYVSKNFKHSTFAMNYSFTNDKGFTANLADEKLLKDAIAKLDDDPYSFDYKSIAKGPSSNFLRKHNISLGASTKLENGLRLNATLEYINSLKRNPPAAVSYGSGPDDGNVSLFSDVLYTPRSIDLLHLPYQSPVDGSMVYYRRGSAIQNPLWTLNNSWEEETVNRFHTSIKADYDLLSWLTFRYQVGLDQYTQINDYKTNKGGSQQPKGFFITGSRLNQILDQQFNLLYDKQLTNDIDVTGIVGLNTNKENRTYTYQSSQEQFIYGLFTHNNFTSHDGSTFLLGRNLIGLYGTATFGYRHYLYLGLQARNDWTSTLEKANRSVFYPSASVSFIPTDFWTGMQDMGVNYLKLRLGYGTSAGYPDPYQTRSVLTAQTKRFITKGGDNINTNTVSNRLGNGDLTAEKHAETELGVEARFLNNRLGLDLSLYNKNSTDLIIDLQLDPSTGYTNTTTNAASINNRGVELGLDITPVQMGAFNWNMRINYTKNKNIVTSLGEGVDQVVIDGFSNLGNFAVKGEPFGVIKGSAYKKNDNGDFLVNSAGEYIESSGLEIIGDPNPNYLLDAINTFQFGNFALNVQLSYRDGGDIWSRTTSTLLARGNTIDTEFDRFFPVILPGVLASDEKTENNIQIYAGDAWFSGYFGADEGSIFDGTTIRLREISLAYDLPKRFLSNTPFGAFSFKLYGQNMWYKAVNFPKGVNFDPEVLSLGVGNGQGFDYLTGPTAKRYGVSLNVRF